MTRVSRWPTTRRSRSRQVFPCFSVTRTRRGSGGSNENTNGLLRQYFPKGTGLSYYSQAELDAVADRLNGRPRQTLNWMTPAEKLDEFLLKADGALTA